jgi:uncharacterized protein YkwD
LTRTALALAVVATAVVMASGNAPDFLRIHLGEAKYEYQPEWAAYLAPEEDCPGGEDERAPVARQRTAMLCLLNWARERRGLDPLPLSRRLTRAATVKVEVMASCDEFAHNPCGVGVGEPAREFGYRGSVGENISWGTGMAGAPRPTVDGWLHSRGHRRNLFRKRWRVQGISLLRPERYQNATQAAVWVSEFGD